MTTFENYFFLLRKCDPSNSIIAVMYRFLNSKFLMSLSQYITDYFINT